jgi:ABC-type glutathione transport system ATPase component
MSTVEPTQVIPTVDEDAPARRPTTASGPAAADGSTPGPARGLAELEAREISCWFGDRLVLDRVSLTMPAGGITALIGPSGCGKSTFLRTLNRMHELVPSAKLAGEVLLDGEDIYAPEKKLTDARRDIGMVFQKPNPFPAMSIRDNVLPVSSSPARRPAARRRTSSSSTASSSAVCGTRSRTASTRLAAASPVASSSACASLGRWRSSRACCSWTSRARPSTRPRPASSRRR